jgi:hypothetical protein
MHRTGWLSGYGDLSLETLTAWASTFKIEDSNIGITVPYVAPYAVKGRCGQNPDSHTVPKSIECTQCETCLEVIERHSVLWVNGNASLPTTYNMTGQNAPKCPGDSIGVSFGPSMTCTQAGTYPGAFDITHPVLDIVLVLNGLLEERVADFQDQLLVRDKRTEARRNPTTFVTMQKQSLRMASSSAECVSTALCPG